MNTDTIVDQHEDTSNESSANIMARNQKAKGSIIAEIEKMLDRQQKWVSWFIFARLFLKTVKVIAGLGTGLAAVITAFTYSPVAAIVTAVTGVLTSLLTVLDSEFRVEKKRRHHTVYMLKFGQLLGDLEFEQNLSYESLQDYRKRFQRTRMAERRDNFLIEDEEGLASVPQVKQPPV